MKQNKKAYRDSILLFLFGGFLSFYFDNMWFLIIGGSLLFLAFAFKPIRNGIHVLMNLITQGLQFIFQPIIGIVLYYVFLTPLALLFRLFRRESKVKDSNFREVKEKYDEAFFERQW